MAALSTWSSLSAPCQTIRPTGSWPGLWQVRDKAQPSSRLMMLVLRSSRLLTRKNSASRAASCAASRPSAGGPTAGGGGAGGAGGGSGGGGWARPAGGGRGGVVGGGWGRKEGGVAGIALGGGKAVGRRCLHGRRRDVRDPGAGLAQRGDAALECAGHGGVHVV